MWGYVGVIAACLVAALFLSFWKRIDEGLRNRLLNFFWTQVFLGGFIFFCRYQQIPYLGSNILRFLQEVSMVVWLGFILTYRVRTVPQKRLAEEAQARFNKYLPKPKTN